MIDPSRHLDVFSPMAFGSRRVDVVGAGMTGSRILLSLAKLGIVNLHVWDFDTVEEHNCANQVYGNQHIGMLKTEAISKIVFESTGTVITEHNELVDGSQRLGEVVYILTDTMNSRMEIWEKALKLKLRTKWLVETRAGVDSARIYSLSPNSLDHISAYEQTFYSDDEAEESACGSPISMGATADIIAGFAVWSLVRWFAIENSTDGTVIEDVPENDILISTRSSMLFSRKF